VQPSQADINDSNQAIPFGEPETAGAPRRMLCEESGSIDDFQVSAAMEGDMLEPPTEES